MDKLLKPTLAELLGTFLLTFIGAGAGALAGSNGGGIVAVALAHGVALMVIIYALGAVSGAHVNPAVTAGLAVTGKIGWDRAVAYWVAQFVGATVAALLLAYIIGPSSKIDGLGATVGSLTTTDPIKTMVLEAILTFFLVTAVYGSGVAGKNGNMAGIAIGFVLLMDILMGGALTGASMNPARTFGPALVTGHFEYLAWYIVGPVVGAIAAAFMYDRLFMIEVPAVEIPAPSNKRKSR
jgi:MIP family channel proteins